MRTIVLGALLALACGGKHKPSPGAGSQAIYAKTMRIGWGIAASERGGTTDVFLQTTDEDGGQKSYPLGAYKGPCKLFAPAAEMKAISGVACSGVELHAVVAQNDVVVLKLDTMSGAVDPMARVEIARASAPAGALIEAGSAGSAGSGK
jgi:hypothetical protein